LAYDKVVFSFLMLRSVLSKCTALLQPETWKVWKESGVGFSLCAVLNYLLSCAQVFSDSIPGVRKFNLEMECSLKKRFSVEFRWKLELFQKYGIRVQNHGVGQVDNENENQC